jgi:predicted lipoprotein with Yx(FWY)xxD motif
VQEGEIPVPGAGVTGEFNVTTRDDGAFQVTYNGQPLYFWGKDENPGDTTGHGVNDVWFVVEP